MILKAFFSFYRVIDRGFPFLNENVILNLKTTDHMIILVCFDTICLYDQTQIIYKIRSVWQSSTITSVFLLS